MSKPKLFIPVVVKSTQPDGDPETRLWQVNCRYATHSERDTEKDQDSQRLHPTVHLLGQFRRYESGMKGLWAVKRLLGSELEDLDDLELALRKRRLESAEGSAWAGRIEENSSDLGLGLTLLLDLLDTPVKVLAATGELGDAEEARSSADLPVKPVRGIPAKLNALLQKKCGDGVLSGLELVFTPWHYLTDNGDLEWVRRLAVVQALEEAGVAVHPVHSFGEAAKILGIDPEVKEQARRAVFAREARKLWLRRAGRFAAGFSLLAALALAVGLASFLRQPIALEWAPMERQAAFAEPFLACLDSQGQAHSRQALAKQGADPIAPSEGYLSWLARFGRKAEGEAWQYRLLRAFGYRGYPLAVVLVGKTSGVSAHSVFIPHAERASREALPAPGAVWSYGVDLTKPAEENLLVLLANRWQPFDPQALKTALQALPKPANGGLDLSAVENYLKSQANVTLRFAFETRDDAPGCPARR